MKTAVGLVVAAAVLLILAVTPLPVRPYLDFQVLYHTDLGLTRGILIYDHAGQVNMIAQLAGVQPGQVYLVPFPYPPWYALTTLWLALAPIGVAARLWFGLNLILLGLALWLLTDGLSLWRRLIGALLAIAFPPVLGSLFVGQYVFPVLLGVALLGRALRRRQVALVAASAALLTFKPHVGGLVLLIGAIYLLRQREDFSRRALLAMLGAGAVLFAIGFLASPAWPAAYYQSLAGFEGVPGVPECTQCVSLPVVIANAFGGGLLKAAIAGAILLALLLAWMAAKWSRSSGRPERLIGAAAVVTLLVSPYLLNYDYVLLLAPFVLLAGEARGLDWAWLGLAYVIPVIGLSVFGTAGNASLIVSAIIAFAQLARVIARPGAAMSIEAQSVSVQAGGDSRV